MGHPPAVVPAGNAAEHEPPTLTASRDLVDALGRGRSGQESAARCCGT